jgi:elongation factor P
MIVATDLKRGVTLRLDNNLYRVVNTQYNKPGRGTASMRTTLMDIATGSTTMRIFSADEKLDNIFVESEMAEYLYDDGEFLHFMNTTTFEQYETNRSLFEDDALYLVEGMQLELRVYEGRPIDYVLPTTVTYEVIDAEAAVAGDTAGAVTKKVTIAGGKQITAPQFINIGDTIKVDTRDGSYVGRG